MKLKDNIDENLKLAAMALSEELNLTVTPENIVNTLLSDMDAEQLQNDYFTNFKKLLARKSKPKKSPVKNSLPKE
ncbi:MAG: hypothetical protein HRT88_05005 [Lentisphaeraceae bacterium]|nr:hypothetical protein [Lentisphaeraceae bacterium]